MFLYFQTVLAAGGEGETPRVLEEIEEKLLGSGVCPELPENDGHPAGK